MSWVARTPKARYDLGGSWSGPLRPMRLRVTGAIAAVLVNRPDQPNAIAPEPLDQLVDCFDRMQVAAGVTGLRLAGAGEASGRSRDDDGGAGSGDRDSGVAWGGAPGDGATSPSTVSERLGLTKGGSRTGD